MSFIKEKAAYIENVVGVVTPRKGSLVYDYMLSENEFNLSPMFISMKDRVSEALANEIMTFKSFLNDIFKVSESIHDAYTEITSKRTSVVKTPIVKVISIPEPLIEFQELGTIDKINNRPQNNIDVLHDGLRKNIKLTPEVIRNFFKNAKSDLKRSIGEYFDKFEDEEIERVINSVFYGFDTPLKADILRLRLTVENAANTDALFMSWFIALELQNGSFGLITTDNSDYVEALLQKINEVVSKAIKSFEELSMNNIFITFGSENIVIVLEKPFERFINEEYPIEVLFGAGLKLDSKLKRLKYDEVINNSKNFVELWTERHKNTVVEMHAVSERELKLIIISELTKYIKEREMDTVETRDVINNVKTFIYNRPVLTDHKEVVKYIERIFREVIYTKTGFDVFMRTYHIYESPQYGFTRDQAIVATLAEIIGRVVSKGLTHENN